MTIEINTILNAAEAANKKGRLNDAIAKLIEAFRVAFPAPDVEYALDADEKVIIQRIQDSPERRVFIVDTGALPEDEAKAHIEKVAEGIQALGTCEPCTPTAENPTGVAEAPVLPNIEDPDFLEKITDLEKAQDAQALGVDVKDVDGELAKVRAKAASKTKAAKDGE